jgi:ketol-acid reductoisomerase
MEATPMGEGHRPSSGPRVAIIGYGAGARDQAVRLRAAGWLVDVVVRPGGMSWIRAVADGLRPVPAAEAATRADVVAVHLPESEQPAVWAYSIAPYLPPGSLVVFAHGSALYSGALDPDSSFDVVLVAGGDERDPGVGCRIAVHRDATGHALERGTAFARAVFGAARIGTTTLDSEARADLSELVAKRGGLPALLAELDRVLANQSHEPDEATLTYYERLRAVAVSGERAFVVAMPARTRADATFMFMARKRGAA